MLIRLIPKDSDRRGKARKKGPISQCTFTGVTRLHDLADQMNGTFEAIQKRHKSMERRLTELIAEAKNREQPDSQKEGIPESVSADV